MAATSGSPNSAEWHAWRAAGIGASDAPVIAAASGLCDPASWMSTVHKLWLVKTGQAEGPAYNAAMRRGTNGEGPARDAVEKATGLLVYPVFGEMDTYPVLRASFDGMDFDGNTIVEIKCPNQTVHDLAKNGEIVGYYVPQLIHQSMVAWGLPSKEWNNKLAIFASFVPETRELALVHRTGRELYTNFDVDTLFSAEKDFWASVCSGIPACGLDFLKKADEYKIMDAKFELVKKEHESLKMELVEMLGKKRQIEGGGVRVLKSSSKGGTDWEKVARKLAEDFNVPTTKLDELIVTFRKKDQSKTYVTVDKPPQLPNCVDAPSSVGLAMELTT